MGIRLEGPQIEWARETGGEGGSHPSNIHDNGYALGTININGDTPVILTNEGPDMGGYVCVATIATAELCVYAYFHPALFILTTAAMHRWKVGQLRPGCKVQFKRISIEQARRLSNNVSLYLSDLTQFVSTFPQNVIRSLPLFLNTVKDDIGYSDPKLHTIPADGETGRPQVVFRQVCKAFHR